MGNYIDGLISGRVGVGGWTDGWKDGWMDRYLNRVMEAWADG